MYSDTEIEALVADLESELVERKRSLSKKSRVEEAICAFANDLPGTGMSAVVLIGVEDASGHPRGRPMPAELHA